MLAKGALLVSLLAACASATSSPHAKAQVERFQSDDATAHHELRVWTRRDSIQFEITSKTLDGETSRRVAGVAKLVKTGDVELDNNEDGEAYEVDEFQFESGKCWLRIRIAKSDRKLARIQETGCEDLRPQEVPFESRVPLHKLG
jgi:hypothetical protein